jgi:excinuclease ABC subunit A
LQRLRLATQVRSNLFGVVYVLDEPSAGLHPADTEALLRALDKLKASGNSLFVVEHEIDVIRHADWIVDVGPAAGEHGGRVLYSGPPEGLRASRPRRPGGTSSSRPRCRPALCARAKAGSLEGVTRNNLRGLDVSFPLGRFTSVTGVSGSGKSSLVSQALVELVAAALGHELTKATRRRGRRAGARRRSSPVGGRIARASSTSSGSCASTSAPSAARLAPTSRRTQGSSTRAQALRRDQSGEGAGYDAGRFSFNVAKGRCEHCEGEGFVSVEMLFLPSVYAPAPRAGRRATTPTRSP